MKINGSGESEKTNPIQTQSKPISSGASKERLRFAIDDLGLRFFPSKGRTFSAALAMTDGRIFSF